MCANFPCIETSNIEKLTAVLLTMLIDVLGGDIYYTGDITSLVHVPPMNLSILLSP